MKITIELNETEVKALKVYLKETSHDINPSITKQDIMEEIKGAINGHLQSGALGDYLREAESKNIERGGMAGANMSDDY